MVGEPDTKCMFRAWWIVYTIAVHAVSVLIEGT